VLSETELVTPEEVVVLEDAPEAPLYPYDQPLLTPVAELVAWDSPQLELELSLMVTLPPVVSLTDAPVLVEADWLMLTPVLSP